MKLQVLMTLQIADKQASDRRINVVEIVDRTIDEDEDKRHNP
jgi:hypothetical protein